MIISINKLIVNILTNFFLIQEDVAVIESNVSVSIDRSRLNC